MAKANVTEIGPLDSGVSNGAAPDLIVSQPYILHITLQGVADLLFHRWDCDAVASKATAAKNSTAKKSDNLESYLYRNDDDMICLPGEYVRQAIIHAAKFRQDPRSPRKSAMDLYKAGVISLTPLASLGTTTYDYEHKARVNIQRNGITRTRPAFKSGWQVSLEFLVNLPEYIPLADIREVLINAGRLIGVGDFRPTYGRFHVVHITQADS